MDYWIRLWTALMALTCFRLSSSRRFIHLKEPKEKFGKGTLLVVGIDEKAITQTLLENLGLWEGLELKWLLHYHDFKYTKTKLNEANLEESVYHLTRFGVRGDITNDTCIYQAFLEAVDYEHLIVMISFEQPSCPDSKLPEFYNDTQREYELIMDEDDEFWYKELNEYLDGNQTLKGKVHLRNYKRMIDIPSWDDDKAWDTFVNDREYVYEILISYSDPDSTEMGPQLVCYAAAPERSACTEKQQTICVKEFSRTRLGEAESVNCASNHPDCRTCRFDMSIRNVTTTPTITSTPTSVFETSDQFEAVATDSVVPNQDTQESERANLGAIIGACVGALLFIFGIAIFIFIMVKRRREMRSGSKSGAITQKTTGIIDEAYSPADVIPTDGSKDTGLSQTGETASRKLRVSNSANVYEDFSVVDSQGTTQIEPEQQGNHKSIGSVEPRFPSVTINTASRHSTNTTGGKIANPGQATMSDRVPNWAIKK